MGFFYSFLLLFFLTLPFLRIQAEVTVLEGLTNTSFPNAEFWYVNYETPYEVIGSLVKSTFENNCQPSVPSSVSGQILFVNWTEASNAGCRYYQELISFISTQQPSVTIFSNTLKTPDIGYITYEPYGDLASYEDLGLKLTLMNLPNSLAFIHLLDTLPPNTLISVTYDEGNWLRYGKSPELIAFVAIFITFYGISLLFISYSIYERGRQNGVKLKLPFFVFLCAWLYVAFRIVDLSVDPLFFYHVVPFWTRYLFLWLSIDTGYTAYCLIIVSWARIGSSINANRWQAKLSRYIEGFAFFNIFHICLAGLLQVLLTAFPNYAFQQAQTVVFFLLIPVVLLMAIFLAGFGGNIIYKLRNSISGLTEASRMAFRNITILMISAVLGMICFCGTIGFQSLRDVSIPMKMASDWVKELAGLWMVLSVIVGLSFQKNRSQKKTSTNDGKFSSTKDKGTETEREKEKAGTSLQKGSSGNNSKDELYKSELHMDILDDPKPQVMQYEF